MPFKSLALSICLNKIQSCYVFKPIVGNSGFRNWNLTRHFTMHKAISVESISFTMERKDCIYLGGLTWHYMKNSCRKHWAHNQSMGQRKNVSPQQESKQWCTLGKCSILHFLGSCVTSLMHTTTLNLSQASFPYLSRVIIVVH